MYEAMDNGSIDSTHTHSFSYMHGTAHMHPDTHSDFYILSCLLISITSSG